MELLDRSITATNSEVAFQSSWCCIQIVKRLARAQRPPLNLASALSLMPPVYLDLACLIKRMRAASFPVLVILSENLLAFFESAPPAALFSDDAISFSASFFSGACRVGFCGEPLFGQPPFGERSSLGALPLLDVLGADCWLAPAGAAPSSLDALGADCWLAPAGAALDTDDGAGVARLVIEGRGWLIEDRGWPFSSSPSGFAIFGSSLGVIDGRGTGATARGSCAMLFSSILQAVPFPLPDRLVLAQLSDAT